MGVPALVLAVIMVAGAVLAFIGAEKVEALLQAKRSPVELTPPSRPRIKLAMGGSLAVLAVVILTAGSPGADEGFVPAAPLAPMALAESIIEREPGLLILDLRADPEAEKGIPGAVPGAVSGADAPTTVELLKGSPPGTIVVVYGEEGTLTELPAGWPRRVEYRSVEGGLSGWVKDVLTPAELWGNTLAERERVQRQNQISAFFSGAAVQSSSLAPPPPMMPAGGAGQKPKSGGC
jgi:hypothetical protein